VCYNISIKVKRLTDVTVKRLVMNRFDKSDYTSFLNSLLTKYSDIEEVEEGEEIECEEDYEEMCRRYLIAQRFVVE